MRVLIADDHALFRDGLRSLIEAHGSEVVAEARDGAQAVRLALEHRPDVVLMDLAMPRGGGLEAIRRLSAEAPELPVLVLTASEDDSDLYEAIRAGAQGYLLKDLETRRFFELVEGAVRGDPAITPALARKLLDEFARSRPRPPRGHAPEDLTQRERDVLEWMVRGVTSNRELSHRMGVKENTVKFHVRNILDKLHLHNRAEAVAYALRHEIVEMEPVEGQG